MASQAIATPSNFLELDGNVVFDSHGTFDWANGHTTNGTEDSTLSKSNGGAAPSTYSRSGAGGLFDGGVYNGSTTPPTSPPRTTAANNDNTIADAQFKVDPLSSDTAPCVGALTPTVGDPTAYTGSGSETNGDLLAADTYGPGSVPNKDDLSNVYAAAHIDPNAPHPGGPAGDVGVNEVFFGAERVVNNGDSHIDFEFLQNSVTLVSDKDRKGNTLCSGKFAGDRAEGDFLLSVDFTTGGNFGGILLYRWDCLLPAKGKPYPTQPADGTVCNPPKTGPTPGPHYQQTGTDAVQINVNGHPNNDNSIENNIKCGGWVCRNADGTPNPQLLTNDLMEGGIDLKQLGFTGCVSTFLPHTRSSQSFTAVLKDFEIIPFSTCAHPTVTTKLMNGSTDVTGGTVSLGTTVHDTAQLHGAVGTPTGTVSYRMYTAAEAAAGCVAGAGVDETPASNALVNGVPPNSKDVTFTSVGTYYFVASAAFTDNRNLGTPSSGCTDEAITVSPNSPSITTAIKLDTTPLSDPPTDSHGTPTVALGTTLRDTSTIANGFNATGNVTYTLYPTVADCLAGTNGTALGVKPLDGTSHQAAASNSFTFNNAGTFYFYASYDGDTNNTGPVNSGCSSEPLVVSPHIPTITTAIKLDTTPLTDPPTDPNNNNTPTVTIGTALRDTSTIGNGFNATGNVTYTLYPSVADCTNGTNGTALGVKAVDSTTHQAPASNSFTFNNAGTFYFYASYDGDGNNTGPVNSGCSSEPLVVTPNIPGYASTPVVQIKDTFTVNGLTYGSTNAATGTVTVALFTGTTGCTTAVTGQSTDFTVTGNVFGTAAHPATADNPAGTFSGATTFYGPATSGTKYWYQVHYTGDNNNTGFTKCEESATATITSH